MGSPARVKARHPVRRDSLGQGHIRFGNPSLTQEQKERHRLESLRHNPIRELRSRGAGGDARSPTAKSYCVFNQRW
jgi:hypothetical protein